MTFFDLNFQQFVPSDVCLKCEGCCRFQLADSDWRPKVGQLESQEGLDKSGYIKTLPHGGHHQCVFFNPHNSTCGIYGHRPFECALYPFVLSKGAKGIEVFVHLACPYVQDNLGGKQMQNYVEYLKEFFARPQVKTFLKDNDRLLHDYTPYRQELDFLFSFELPA